MKIILSEYVCACVHVCVYLCLCECDVSVCHCIRANVRMMKIIYIKKEKKTEKEDEKSDK